MKVNRERLRLAMARACMDTHDLAKVADMPRPTVNNVITGRSIRPATLGRIARALNCDVEDLVKGE